MTGTTAIRSNRATTMDPMLRLFLIVAAILAAIAGIELFVLSDATAQFFAWTVNPPIAAAFFGGGFLAITAAALWGLWVRDARQVEPFLPVAIVATVAILIASVLHVDRFHLTSPDPLPLLAAWAWLIVYVVVPLALLAYWVRSMPARRFEAVRRGLRRPIPSALRAALAALCISAAILAVIAFILPTSLRWPYQLTPLTARMTGAFLASLAAATLMMLLTDDLVRLRVAPITLVVFGALSLTTLPRFQDTVSATGAGIWVYVALFTATTVLGAAVLALALRAPESDAIIQ
jgi:hypothetical protein